MDNVENVFFKTTCEPGDSETLCSAERGVIAAVSGSAICGKAAFVKLSWEPKSNEVAFELEELSFDQLGSNGWFEAERDMLIESTWRQASRSTVRGGSVSPSRQMGAGVLWRWRAVNKDGSTGRWLYAEWTCSLI